HMARSRSKADGRADNEMGRWELILGIVFLALLAFGWMLGISAGIVGGMVSLLGACSDGSGGTAAIQQPSLLSSAVIVSATTKPASWLSASIGSVSVAVFLRTHVA